jgi:cellulose synthase/poly-beta-1,6-N-acetylglucosamine synthase-like glycosyltransferase
MLRSCVQDIKNQSYENIFHSINITLDVREVNKMKNYYVVYDDLQTEKNMFSYSQNKHQHFNHLTAITNVPDYESYDIFVKIDDDDIYKKDYIKTIVEFFDQNNVDVVSSKMKYQLNGNLVKVGDYGSLGGNPKNCDFKIPATFAFNLKALKLIQNVNKIYGFEDNMWRDIWCDNCNILEIDNSENIVWHIHGKNISTADFLMKQ